MTNPASGASKNPSAKLHTLNLVVALLGGLISVVGGVYSLKMNFFTPKTGSLKGIVRDESIAKPLWFAPVEIADAEGSIIATASTNQEGRYSFSSLKEGNYVVKISAPLHKVQSKNVRIDPPNASQVDFDLAPEEEKPAPAPVLPGALRPEAPPPQSSWQEQEEEVPVEQPQYPRRSSRRRQSGTADGQQGTIQNALIQAVGQYIQDWASKKTGGKT